MQLIDFNLHDRHQHTKLPSVHLVVVQPDYVVSTCVYVHMRVNQSSIVCEICRLRNAGCKQVL